MSNNQVLHATVPAIDVHEALAYPATASVHVMQSDLGTVHHIYYAGVPSTDFANAPNSSVLFDNTNGDAYIKLGAVGSGIGGTWTKASP
jgi:hypothetical protein